MTHATHWFCPDGCAFQLSLADSNPAAAQPQPPTFLPEIREDGCSPELPHGRDTRRASCPAGAGIPSARGSLAGGEGRRTGRWPWGRLARQLARCVAGGLDLPSSRWAGPPGSSTFWPNSQALDASSSIQPGVILGVLFRETRAPLLLNLLKDNDIDVYEQASTAAAYKARCGRVGSAVPQEGPGLDSRPLSRRRGRRPRPPAETAVCLFLSQLKCSSHLVAVPLRGKGRSPRVAQPCSRARRPGPGWRVPAGHLQAMQPGHELRSAAGTGLRVSREAAPGPGCPGAARSPPAGQRPGSGEGRGAPPPPRKGLSGSGEVTSPPTPPSPALALNLLSVV